MPETENVAPTTPSTPLADEVLLHAEDVARAGLLEITEAETVGRVVGHVVEGEHVLSLLFECTLTGYPGWHWTVTMSRIDADAAPSVLETELMPGEHALLAPEWVPWSDRLAEYRTTQEAAAALAAANAGVDGELADGESADDESDDDEDDLDDEHDDLDDIDDVDELHDDDIDGVDFEHHDADESDAEDDEDDDESDEEEDSDEELDDDVN